MKIKKFVLIIVITCFVMGLTSFFAVPPKKTLLMGKGFSYQVYCSKRDSFYLVELHATIKYHWAGKLMPHAQSDTVASTKDTYLIRSKKSFKLVHKDIINCKLKLVEQDSAIYNQRKSFFSSYFRMHCNDSPRTDTMTYQKIFEEYDQYGILDVR